jgi:hypothetical protein
LPATEERRNVSYTGDGNEHCSKCRTDSHVTEKRGAGKKVKKTKKTMRKKGSMTGNKKREKRGKVLTMFHKNQTRYQDAYKWSAYRDLERGSYGVFE